MQTEMLMKKKPAAHTRRSAGNCARFQGGDGRRQMTGRPGGVGLRAHNWSLPAQQSPADKPAEHHWREDKQDDGQHGVHGSALLLRGGWLGADQFGRQVPASDGGLDSVTDGVGELFRPLTDSRSRNADCFGGGCHGAPEQVNGLRFVHSLRLAC